MKTRKSDYEQRGVSSSKADVHHAIRNLDKGLFPEAFCKILPDILGGNPHRCNILHADTAGTKTSLAYLAWKLTGNIDFAANVAVDALIMNVDDVACVGAVKGMLANQTIGKNSFLVPAEFVEAIITKADQTCALLRKHGINCHFAGGETASVPDVVRTLDVGSSVAAGMKRKDVIDAYNMVPGDFIVGFSSTGQAVWETSPNSGIGSNGLTNARHDILSPHHRKFKETYAPQLKRALTYRGPYKLKDKMPEDPTFTIAQALLSPTRTYAPLIGAILQEFPRKHIHGFIHCSGGGQTKILKFGLPGNRYVKYNPFKIPPLFRMLEQVSEQSLQEMYQTYNMGWRLEAVVSSQHLANEIAQFSETVCSIDSQIVGEVTARPSEKTSRKVLIDVGSGNLVYEGK